MKEAWEALADHSRREILTLLNSRPHTAGEIADQFDLSAATVSHHLRVLKEGGLVTATRRKQTIIYAIDPVGIRKAIRYLKALLDGKG